MLKQTDPFGQFDLFVANVGTLVREKMTGENVSMSARVREKESKRLLVNVKSKQKHFSKWPSVKGKDHRFSLLLVRGFCVTSHPCYPFVWETLRESGFKKKKKRNKKTQEGKIDSRATLMQPEHFR